MPPAVCRHPTVKRFFPVGLVLLLTLILYFPSLDNGFVRDDPFIVVNNDFIKSWANFPKIFTREYLTNMSDKDFVGVRLIGSGEASYRPVVTISYFLDYAFWKLNPLGYHAHNLALHLFNTFLVYLLLFHFTRRRPAAFIGALLFGWHPVNTEAVCAIANREDLQVFFFYALSFYAYIRFREDGGQQRWLAVALSSFFLALFSKEMAVTLPLVVFLYDYLYQREKPRPRAAYGGFLAIAAFYGVIRFFVFAPTDAPQGHWLGGGGLGHVASMLRVIAAYARWLAFPVGVHVTIPEDLRFISPFFMEDKVLLALLLLGALLAMTFFLRRGWRDIRFALGWFFITLIPVMNIIPLQNFVALRFLYLSSFGFCLIASGLLARVWPAKGVFQKRTVVLGILMALVLGGYARAASRMIAVWRTDFALMQDMVRYYPEAARVRCILGMQYHLSGDLHKALEEYEATLRLAPGYGKAYLCRGMIYQQMGLIEKAVVNFQEAIRLDPRLWQARFFLGNIFARKKMYPQAEEQYQELLKAAPLHVPVYNNLGMIYFYQGQNDKARAMWQKALTIDADNAFALQQLTQMSQ